MFVLKWFLLWIGKEGIQVHVLLESFAFFFQGLTRLLSIRLTAFIKP